MADFRLSPEERALCALIREACVANHFSADRPRPGKKTSGITGAPATVAALVGRMEEKNSADLNRYEGQDRELVFFAFLFDIFNRFMDDFDRHIIAQAASGDRILPVDFANKAFAHFKKRGFSREDGARFFEIFFQLRRANYFIEKQFAGKSPCMQKLRTSLWDTIFTHDPLFYKQHLIHRMNDFSMLITGETGTGKYAAASAIGMSGYIPFNEKSGSFSESFTKTFVSIKLSRFPEALIESELFGRKKGAVPEAINAYQGIFNACNRYGSILLDEIDATPIHVQAKLLKVINERTFSPVGSHERQRFSGRVIASTNKDLFELRKKGLFRDDFYSRLCSDILRMPTLAERISENPAELENHIEHFIRNITGSLNTDLMQTVKKIIQEDPGIDYSWPGNMLELEQHIRAIIINGTPLSEQMPPSTDAANTLVREMRKEDITANDLLSRN
jgi:transcriptional regulator of acetoin/glycerol metabolism